MFEQPAYGWRDPEWRAAAESWIGAQAAAAGREVVGPVGGVRFLPWSAVLRAPTNSGDVYFKACGPSQLAADIARGWLLMPDGGPTLRPVISDTAAGLAHWPRVLAELAAIQHATIPHTADLLALGVPDRRPAALAAVFAAIVERSERLLLGQGEGLTRDEFAQLRALRPLVDDLCAELAASPLPAVLVHDDLHEDHVFAAPNASGAWRYTFFDYGDACLSHPFLQMVSQPRFVPNRYREVHNDVLNWLYENFLHHWRKFTRRELAPPPGLRRALQLALALGPIMRVQTWLAACGSHHDALEPDLRGYYLSGTGYWLRQLIERTKTEH